MENPDVHDLLGLLEMSPTISLTSAPFVFFVELIEHTRNIPDHIKHLLAISESQKPSNPKDIRSITVIIYLKFENLKMQLRNFETLELLNIESLELWNFVFR